MNNFQVRFVDCNSNPLAARKVLLTPTRIPEVSSSYQSIGDSYTFTSSLDGVISSSIVPSTYKVDINNPTPVTSFYIVSTETGSYIYSGSIQTGVTQSVFFDLINLHIDPFSTKKLTLTPQLNTPIHFSGSIVTLPSTTSLTDANGVVEFHSLVPGEYLVDAKGKIDSTWYISVPNWNSSGSDAPRWNSKDLIIVKPAKGIKVKLNGSDVSFVLSLSASDARYLPISANNTSISASYALTASFALNGGGSSSNATQSIYSTQSLFSTQSLRSTQSLFATQSLNATNSLTAVAATSSLTSQTASISINGYFASASAWSTNSLNAQTASFAVSASYAPSGNGNSANSTQSLFSTQSLWATNSLNAQTASIALNALFASSSLSASYAPGSPTVQSQYATQSLWATSSLTASLLLGSVVSSSYAQTASIALNTTTADFAVLANSSLTASWALNVVGGGSSGNATQSLFATQSRFATQSLNATNSISASYSVYADSAAIAEVAKDADNATSASYAIDSVNAFISTYSTQSLYATQSLRSTQSLNATNSINAQTSSYHSMSYRPFNVKDFGAIGNNSNDDTVAIQNCINACLTASGGTVYFPSGIYKLTNELFFNTYPINFLGDGTQRSKIYQSNSASNVFHVRDPQGLNDWSFREIEIYGVGRATSSGSGILVESSTGSVDNAYMEHVLFRDLNYGLKLSSFSNSTLVSVALDNCNTGMYFDSSSNSVTLNGCDFTADNTSTLAGFTAVGIRFASGVGLTIIGGDFGGPAMRHGLVIDGGLSFSWHGSNCEVYNTKYGIDGFISSSIGGGGTHLLLDSVVLNDYGGNLSASYPIVQANEFNVTMAGCCRLSSLGLHGGHIKHLGTAGTDTIDLSNGNYIVDVYSGPLYLHSYKPTPIPTTMYGDTLTLATASRGVLQLSLQTGSLADKFYWINKDEYQGYYKDNLNQYNSDKRAGLVATSTNYTASWAINVVSGSNGVSASYLNGTALTNNITSSNGMIVSAGRVGIGTSKPSASLHVEGGTVNGLLVTTANNSPWGIQMLNQAYSTDPNNGLSFYQDSAGSSYFYNGGTSAFNIPLVFSVAGTSGFGRGNTTHLGVVDIQLITSQIGLVIKNTTGSSVKTSDYMQVKDEYNATLLKIDKSGSITAPSITASLLQSNLVGTSSLYSDDYLLSGSYVSIITGSSTLTSAQNGKFVVVNSGSKVVVTVPSGLSQGFACSLYQSGSGQAVVTGSGVNIRNRASLSASNNQYSVLTLLQIDSNNYIVQGDVG